MTPRVALLCCALLLPAPAAARPAVRHVVIITVDGLRPDAIAAAPAPRLQALAARGAASLAARVAEIPETLPSHVSMATGVPPSVHGVTWNSDQDRTLERDTLFTRVHEAGGRTGLYFGKSKLRLLAPRGSADVSWGPAPRGAALERGAVDAVAARFAADFPRERFRLAWVHLREPDWAGHTHGWMSAPYLAAVRQADAAVGVMLEAIAASGLGARTAVLVTSDHGGEGTSHGDGRGETSWLIPWICQGPGRRGATIARPPTQLDVAPTVLAWLELAPPPDARGRAIAECLG